jgi:hypothetical protein
MKVVSIIVLATAIISCSKQHSLQSKTDTIRPSTTPVATPQPSSTSTLLAADLEGTYYKNQRYDLTSEVLVEAIDSHSVKVQINACDGKPNADGMGGGVHCGTGTGTGTLMNDSVQIVIDTVNPEISPLGCSFTLAFRKGHRLLLRHDGGAGSFGMVNGGGLYRRVKKGKPKFDE